MGAPRIGTDSEFGSIFTGFPENRQSGSRDIEWRAPLTNSLGRGQERNFLVLFHLEDEHIELGLQLK